VQALGSLAAVGLLPAIVAVRVAVCRPCSLTARVMPKARPETRAADPCGTGRRTKTAFIDSGWQA
jgi:hypothetical protein